MDRKDGSFASSERAIMCHTNPTSYWKYVLLQDTLTSAHFVRQEVEQEPLQELAQLPASSTCRTNF